MYPDTTRTVYWGAQLDEDVEPANMHFVHTMNEPQHTLQNGIIIPQENTGTRMNDNGQSRGKRSSTLKLQAYVRHDDIGLWLESAIGAGSTVNYQHTNLQRITLTGVPTGGTFTAKLGTDGTPTAGIAYNASAAAVQAAFVALAGVDPGDIVVTGVAGGPWTLDFEENLIFNVLDVITDSSALTGGTSPTAVVSKPSITGAYLRTYEGGIVRPVPACIKWFNGLYWRRIMGARINTLNIQGFGAALAMIDAEIIGKASTKIADPDPLDEDDTYVPVDVPMQSVRFDGTTDADMDRMSIQINNNLTQRSTMDGTTSTHRTRFGFFQLALDGMVDYPAYDDSLYEAFENNTPVGAMDLLMMDDQHFVGSSTPKVHPFIQYRVPQPLLADTSEGSDGGELVQMVKGRGQYNPTEGAGLIVHIANDKPTAFYDAS